MKRVAFWGDFLSDAEFGSCEYRSSGRSGRGLEKASVIYFFASEKETAAAAKANPTGREKTPANCTALGRKAAGCFTNAKYSICWFLLILQRYEGLH